MDMQPMSLIHWSVCATPSSGWHTQTSVSVL